MNKRFEGDEVFCIIALIISRALVSQASFLLGLGIPLSRELLAAIGGVIQTSLIIGLFYGPASKKISKKIFSCSLLVFVVLLVMAEYM